MAKNRVTFKGSRRLSRKLRNMPANIRAELREEQGAIAEEVRFEMLTQLGSGDPDMASAVEVRVSRGGTKVEVGPGARTKGARQRAGWRAHFKEFGTAPGVRMEKRGPRAGTKVNHPGTPAEPFVLPSFEAKKADVLRAMDEAIGRALRKAGTRVG